MNKTLDKIFSLNEVPNFSEVVNLISLSGFLASDFSKHRKVFGKDNLFSGPSRVDLNGGFVDNFVYHIYTKEMVNYLSSQISDCTSLSGNVVEVCAGSGKLSNVLSNTGLSIVGTDILPRNSLVEKLDCMSAIEKYKPETVVASWLPMCDPNGNSLELQKEILSFDCVKNYFEIKNSSNSICFGCDDSGYEFANSSFNKEVLDCSSSVPIDLFSNYHCYLRAYEEELNDFFMNPSLFLQNKKTLFKWTRK